MKRNWFDHSYVGLAVVAVFVLVCYGIWHGTYILGALVLAGIYAVVVLGLVLLGGLSGQYSLGHAAFFGIGAYTAAILSQHGVPDVAGAAAAIVLTTAISVIVGVPLMRLRGFHLAVGTLALGLVVASILIGWRSLTLGPSGITAIPPFRLGSFAFVGDDGNYWLAWGIVLAGLWSAINLWRSRSGQALLAIKRDEVAAAAMGIDVVSMKVQIFALSAFFAAIGGMLYAHYISFVSPDRFDSNGSFELLFASMLGGIGTPFGAVVGALLLVFLPSVIAPLHDYQVMVYGVVFILVSLYFTRGIAGSVLSGIAYLRAR